MLKFSMDGEPRILNGLQQETKPNNPKTSYFRPNEDPFGEETQPTSGLIDEIAKDFPDKELVSLRSVVVSINGDVQILDKNVFNKLIKADSDEDTYIIPDVQKVIKDGREKKGDAFLVESINPQKDYLLPDAVFSYSTLALQQISGAVSKEDSTKLRSAILVYDSEKLQPAPDYGNLGVRAKDGENISSALLKIYVLPTTK